MSVRTEKVASLIKELMSEIILRNFRMEQFGLMTVTEVRVTPDLKLAKVYVSVFGDADKKKNALAHLEVEKGAIRSELGHNMNLKFTPVIAFYLDETLDYAMKIENLINQIHKDPPGDKE
jgi:ribosome-binding factor A